MNRGAMTSHSPPSRVVRVLAAISRPPRRASSSRLRQATSTGPNRNSTKLIDRCYPKPARGVACRPAKDQPAPRLRRLQICPAPWAASMLCASASAALLRLNQAFSRTAAIEVMMIASPNADQPKASSTTIAVSVRGRSALTKRVKSDGCCPRIEDLDAGMIEIRDVPRGQGQAVHDRRRGDLHVENRSWYR